MRRLACILLGVVACGGASTPTTLSVPPAPLRAAKVTAPLLRAAWFRRPEVTLFETATAVGPEVDDGTVVTLGGRLAMLGKDGTLRTNDAPWPAPVTSVIEVATANGRHIVARAGAGILRIDDPLAAPVPLAHVEGGEERLRIGSGPGLVAFWEGPSLDTPEHVVSDARTVRFLDPDSGDEVDTPAPFVQQPVSALAFRTPSEGAAVLRAAGLVATHDGGLTWQTVTTPLLDVDVPELALEGGAVVIPSTFGPLGIALGGNLEGSRPIDLAAAQIGKPMPVPPGAALLRWIRLTEEDPLLVAAKSGIPLPSGDVLILHLRTQALVKPNGLVTDVRVLPGGGCEMRRAGDSAWIRCYGDMPKSEIRLFRVTLRDGPLTMEPSIAIPGYSGPIVPFGSPGGGVLLDGGCAHDQEGRACVHQPDDTWKSIALGDARDSAWRITPCALADGRVVASRYTGNPRDAASGHVAFVAIDAAGHEEILATLDHPGASPSGWDSSLRELEDHSITALLHTSGGLASLVITPQHVATLTPLKGYEAGGLAGAHGVLFGAGGKMAVTEDGGASWNEEAIPPSLALQGTPADVQVSEAGMFAERPGVGFVGWGMPGLPPPAAPEGDRGATISTATPGPSTGGPSHPNAEAIHCSRTGKWPRPMPNAGVRPPQPLRAPFPYPPRTTDRHIRLTWGQPTWSVNDLAALDLTGSTDKPGAALYWYDPFEVGGGVHSWTGQPGSLGQPDGAQTMMARGPSVLLELDTPVALAGGLLGQTRAFTLLRVDARGHASAAVIPAEIGFDPATPETVAIGRGDGAPAAWFTGSDIAVWLPGETPRVLARVAQAADIVVGEPTKDAVPVMLLWTGGALLRSLPMLPPGKTYGRDVWLTGWQSAPDIRGEARSFPACGKNTAGGARFRVTTELDFAGDVRSWNEHPVAEVVVWPGRACLAGFGEPDESGGSSTTTVIRGDLVSGTGERVIAYETEGRYRCTVEKR